VDAEDLATDKLCRYLGLELTEKKKKGNKKKK